MKFSALVYVLSTFSLISCDCNQVVSGVMVDKSTGLTIAGVSIHKKGKPYGVKSDNVGRFNLSEVSGGFGCHCPPMTVIIEATGYQPVEVTMMAGGNEKIELQTAQSISHQ